VTGAAHPAAGSLERDLLEPAAAGRPGRFWPTSTPSSRRTCPMPRPPARAGCRARGSATTLHGIPALALGCARGRDMHALGERIERASLDLGCAQLDGVLRRFPGG
jgi:hypothetical protein